MNQCFILSVLLVCLIFDNGISQKTGPQNLVDLQESPAGSNIIRFLEVVNSDESIGKQTIDNIFSQSMIEKYGAEGLLALIDDIRENDGKLELYDADREEIFRYKLKLKSVKTGEWLDSEVNLENKQPYKINGFSIMVSGIKARSETPIYSPENKSIPEFHRKPFPPVGEIIKKTDSIAQAYRDLNWFSGVILLAKDGEPFYQKAFGFADEESKIPNTPETKFRIGSINKDYTDVLIMQIVENGTLNPDDKLSRFKLGFPDHIAEKITIRQILLHQAGFSDIFIPEYMENIRDYKEIDDILPLLLEAPLIYEPGTDQRYSNYGYIVLGAILEKMSGKEFGELLKENVLKVLGTSTTHYDIAENIEGEAKSYRFTASGEKADHTSKLEYCTPDGGMYATASDLLHFYQTYYYTEKLLSGKWKAVRAFDYETSSLSWDQIINNPNAGMATAGGGPGVSAVVLLEFAENFCAVILANTDQGIAGEIERRIGDVIRHRTIEPIRLPAGHFIYQTLLEKGEDYVAENIDRLMEENGYQEVHPALLNRLGYVMMRYEDPDDAIRVLHLNTRLFPDQPNPWDSLAEAWYRKGDRENAMKYCKKALEIDPDFPSALELMQKLVQ